MYSTTYGNGTKGRLKTGEPHRAFVPTDNVDREPAEV